VPEWREEIRRRLLESELRPEQEADVVDEIAQHLEDRYRELIGAGRSDEAARGVALDELAADGALAREVRRALPHMPLLPAPGGPEQRSWLAGLGQDIGYSFRRLRARPLFTLTAVATVALTIGPATAVIGMADALFFTPKPGVSQPDRVFLAQFGRPGRRAGSFSPSGIPASVAQQIGAGGGAISAIAGQQRTSGDLAADGVEPKRVTGTAVQPGYFELLGAPMAAGRTLLPEDDAVPGGEPSLVLAEGLSLDMFGSPAAAINKTVQLNSVPFTVVGVVAAPFEGAVGASKFWIPGNAGVRMRHFPPEKWADFSNATRGPFYEYVVRFSPGATYETVAAELDSRLSAVGKTFPEFSGLTFKPWPGLGAPRDLNTAAVEAMRLLSIVAVVLVLLGTANMANLLIFRGLKIGREIAIRRALGASAARLVQLSLVESVILALAGAAVGIGVALAIEAALAQLSIPSLGKITVPIDWRLLMSTAGVAVLTGLSFGVAPAMLSARGSVSAALGRGTRGDAPRVGKIRQGLAALQLGLSLFLLVGAFVFLATVNNLRHVDVGFEPSGLTSAILSLRDHGYDEARSTEYYQQMLARLEHQPGVESVAIAYALPVSGFSFTGPMGKRGAERKDMPDVIDNYVTASYFNTLKTRIVRGRAFTAEEAFAKSDLPPTVLSDTAAKLIFGDEDPLGQIITEPGRPSHDYLVVGVTQPVRWDSVQGPYNAVIYRTYGAGIPVSGGSVVVRSSQPFAIVKQQVAAAAVSIDPTMPLVGYEKVTTTIDGRFGSQMLFAYVLGILGAIGFLLAAVGLHGLVAQMVSERTREFAIRLAIGASYRSVTDLVVRQGAAVAGVGVTLGLAAAWFAGRLVQAQVFGVSVRSPLIFAMSIGALVVVVAVALVGPLRSAMRVQPISVLRSE
jgi:predicted permease